MRKILFPSSSKTSLLTKFPGVRNSYHRENKTVVRKSNVSITEDKMLKLLGELNSNKAYGCDNMSIRMLQMCDTANS